jgi:hypothetical protein
MTRSTSEKLLLLGRRGTLSFVTPSPAGLAPATLVQGGTVLASPLDQLLRPWRVNYIEMLESNAHVIYPALVVLAVLLIALAIIQSIRTEEMDAVQKAEIKRKVLGLLRRNRSGLTAEVLARSLRQPTYRVAKLLEEMTDDNLVEAHTDTKRLTTWRVKGTGDA